MRLVAMTLAVLLGSCFSGRADTLADARGNDGFNSIATYYGQSFTVVGTGQFNSVAFNYYWFTRTGIGPAYALGTGFLFSSAYVGTPGDLGSTSAGLLGTAQAVDGVYQFDSSVILDGGQVFYFYENALIPGRTISGSAPYTGGQSYLSGDSSTSFAPTATATAAFNNFTVVGTPLATPPAATPEPSTWALLATGILAVALVERRRFSF